MSIFLIVELLLQVGGETWEPNPKYIIHIFERKLIETAEMTKFWISSVLEESVTPD